MIASMLSSAIFKPSKMWARALALLKFELGTAGDDLAAEIDDSTAGLLSG